MAVGTISTESMRGSSLALRSASTYPRTVWARAPPVTCPSTSFGVDSTRSPPIRMISVEWFGTDGPRDMTSQAPNIAITPTTKDRATRLSRNLNRRRLAMAGLLRTRLHDGSARHARSGIVPAVFGLIYPYGIVLQVLAILHFVRRRPDTYWVWIIVMFGGVGALIYIVVEVIPDAGLLRGTFQVYPRRKRIRELEALTLDNPSIGNYEELGDLYLDDRQFARAGMLRQGAC